jgi:uncharacterized membrane protein YeaQ/YmgE (transglycosylase-associated protein family)
MIITIIAWIVLGAIAGYIAKFLIPGDQGLGVVGTIILGIIGAFVGGFIAMLLNLDGGAAQGGDVVNIWSIVLAVIGAIVVVFVYGLITSRGRTV